MKGFWIGLAVAAGAAVQAQEPATRGDLALAYREVERALAVSGPLSEARRVEVNQAFDRATLAFFSGATGRALRSLRELSLELRGGSGELARALPGVELDPPVWVRGEAAPRVVLSSPAGADGLALRLREAEGQQVVASARVPAGERETALPAMDLPQGVYLLEAHVGDVGVPLRRFTVCEADPTALRAKLEARLTRLGPSPDREILAARLKLLTRTPDPQDTTQVLSRLPELMRGLPQELAGLESGRRPYRGKLGSCWRPYRVGERSVGLRVYGPRAARGGEPLPLVVAFHGAGGDENMFAWGYGRGVLQELAEREGFLLATPRTEAFVRDPGAAFGALLATLARDYPIARGRIYALGHSLGVMALDGVLRMEAQPLAAAVCFSGMPRSVSALPIHALLGAKDPLVPARMARSNRASLEVSVLQGYGHTLGVGPNLPGEVEWLLGRPGWR